MTSIKRLLALALTAALASCGGGSDEQPGSTAAPGGSSSQPLAPASTSSARLDRELSACRSSLAAGLAPALPERASLRALCFEAFAVVHDADTRTPRVVFQAIDRSSLLAAQAVPRVDGFYQEARLPEIERSKLSDYSGSGFDRGHMAPAADMPTVNASAQSFSLANVVPQVPENNSGAWARIEADTRSYVMRASGVVYIATGAFFDASSGSIGSGRVRVPAALFKLVYDPTAGRSWAHWQANSAQTTAGPPITRQELLNRLGYDPMPGASGS